MGEGHANFSGIRRRGKNKVAAQNCRRRKIDGIEVNHLLLYKFVYTIDAKIEI